MTDEVGLKAGLSRLLYLELFPLILITNLKTDYARRGKFPSIL